jgi:hypothetical protein
MVLGDAQKLHHRGMARPTRPLGAFVVGYGNGSGLPGFKGLGAILILLGTLGALNIYIGLATLVSRALKG